jgi:hypothetical protein
MCFFGFNTLTVLGTSAFSFSFDLSFLTVAFFCSATTSIWQLLAR